MIQYLKFTQAINSKQKYRKTAHEMEKQIRKGEVIKNISSIVHVHWFPKHFFCDFCEFNLNTIVRNKKTCTQSLS